MLPLAPLGIHEHVRFFSVTELFRLLIGSRTGTLPAIRRQGSRASRVLAASDFPNSSPKVAEAFNHRIRSPKQVYSLDVYRHFSKFGKFGMHSHRARTEETLLAHHGMLVTPPLVVLPFQVCFNTCARLVICSPSNDQSPPLVVLPFQVCFNTCASS